MRKALVFGALLINLSLGSVALAQSPPLTELTLDQARRLAVHAWQSGNPEVAIKLSKGLLKADRRDAIAYYVIAQSYAGLSQANLARRAATRAYRFSESDAARFRAGQLAAKMAYAENKPSLAQVWLRRTAVYAPSEREEALVARDYRTLRALNPWSLRVRADLRSSDNINNGSDAALNVIDGIPVGIETNALKGRALSGVVGLLDLATTYRLRADKRSSTALGGRLYIRRVAFSSSAKALIADPVLNPFGVPVRPSEFGSTYAEISLRHAFAVGDADKKGTAAVKFDVGESWYAERRNFRFARLTGERSWLLGQGRTRLTLNAMAEDRFKHRSTANDARIYGIGGALQHSLENGNSINFTLSLRDATSKSPTGFGTFSSASMRISYTLAKSVGPAKVTAGLIMGYSNYPRLLASASPVFVYARRQDRSIYADLSLFFEDYDYAGFAPLLRIRAGRKFSNFSLSESREFSVSLGFQSTF